MYADLATVFHWQVSEIDKLTLDDLFLFHYEAAERNKVEN